MFRITLSTSFQDGIKGGTSPSVTGGLSYNGFLMFYKAFVLQYLKIIQEVEQ